MAKYIKKIFQCIQLALILVLLLVIAPISAAYSRCNLLLLNKYKRCTSSNPLYVTSKANMMEGKYKEVFDHSKITWSIVPFTPDGSKNWFEIIKLRLASKAIRLDCSIKGQAPPFVLFPSGGRAVVEAYVGKRGILRRKKRVGRFGITTNAGPTAPAINESIRDCFQLEPAINIRVGAIIYEFVEPEYRSQNIGCLANELISAMHAYQGCDFTILVADDDGSGKLVKWYENAGYMEAPKMQEMMGSPDKKFGTSMISPTKAFSQNQWKSLNLKW